MELAVSIILFVLLLFLLFLFWKYVAYPFCPDEIIGIRLNGAFSGATLLLAVTPTFLLMHALTETLQPTIDLREATIIRIEMTLCVFVPFVIIIGHIFDLVIAKTNHDFNDWWTKRKKKH